MDFVWLGLAGILLVNTALFSMVCYHYFNKEYDRCVNSKRAANAIVNSRICTEADVREAARDTYNIDCMEAKNEIAMHPRTCAYRTVLRNAYSAVHENVLAGVHGEFSRVWSTLSSGVAFMTVYPLAAIFLLAWLIKQKQDTQRYTLELQSRDRIERHRMEQFDRAMNMAQQRGLEYDRPARQRRLSSGGPRISEVEYSSVESCESSDESEYETAEQIEAHDEPLSPPAVSPRYAKRHRILNREAVEKRHRRR